MENNSKKSDNLSLFPKQVQARQRGENNSKKVLIKSLPKQSSGETKEEKITVKKSDN